jgi:hypothetical protein
VAPELPFRRNEDKFLVTLNGADVSAADFRKLA